MKFYYIKNIILKLVFLLVIIFQLALLNTRAMPHDHMSQDEVEVNIESLYNTNPKAIRTLKEALSKYRKYLQKKQHVNIVVQDAQDRLKKIGKRLGLNHSAIDGMLYWSNPELNKY